jgi:hypothetical protein
MQFGQLELLMLVKILFNTKSLVNIKIIKKQDIDTMQ